MKRGDAVRRLTRRSAAPATVGTGACVCLRVCVRRERGEEGRKGEWGGDRRKHGETERIRVKVAEKQAVRETAEKEHLCLNQKAPFGGSGIYLICVTLSEQLVALMVSHCPNFPTPWTVPFGAHFDLWCARRSHGWRSRAYRFQYGAALFLWLQTWATWRVSIKIRASWRRSVHFCP